MDVARALDAAELNVLDPPEQFELFSGSASPGISDAQYAIWAPCLAA